LALHPPSVASFPRAKAKPFQEGDTVSEQERETQEEETEREETIEDLDVSEENAEDVTGGKITIAHEGVK
jgi:hypothetical protein